MVTVLIPQTRGEASDWAAKVRPVSIEPEGAAFGVEIAAADGRTLFVGARGDLRRDMVRDWRRPRYTYEAGRIRLGEFETDGDLLFAALDGRGPGAGQSSLRYTIVNLTKALFRNETLVEAKPSNFGLRFDGSPDGPGVGKLRYWRDEVGVKAR